MGFVGWLFVALTLIWVVYIDSSLEDLKLLSRLLYVCLCVNAWVYLCVPIKSSFAIDLFWVDMTLIEEKGAKREVALSLFVCLWQRKGRGRGRK